MFPELRQAALAKDRIVTAERVIAAAPEVFIGSWCGKPVRTEKVRARGGWGEVPFVRDDRLFEVKSTYILQPGPAALTEGVRQLHALLCGVVGVPPPWSDFRPPQAALAPEARAIGGGSRAGARRAGGSIGSMTTITKRVARPRAAA